LQNHKKIKDKTLTESPGHSQGYIFWENAVQEKDWKEALDFLIASLRDFLVFDNLAVYIIDKQGETSEIAYARAVGREKFAEADANWGLEIANQVLEKNEIVVKAPEHPQQNKERKKTPICLACPCKHRGR
jgi:frataxin-like iron-binding protein CyaY